VREPPALVALAAFDYAVYGPLRFLVTAHAALAEAIEEKAPYVRAPTLVVRGSRDALVSQEFAELVTRRLPHARLVVVPGAPHVVNYADPAALARLTRDFLSERSAGASA